MKIRCSSGRLGGLEKVVGLGGVGGLGSVGKQKAVFKGEFVD